MNAFFNFQFSYCPLTWMFHSRRQNNKINKLHERCFWIIHSDNTRVSYEELVTYEKLLEYDKSVWIHRRNLQALAVELYKIMNGFSPDIMKDVFQINTSSTYNTRNWRMFRFRLIKTVYFGSETLSYLGPKIWELFQMNSKA